jgi:hypothetical protein
VRFGQVVRSLLVGGVADLDVSQPACVRLARAIASTWASQDDPRSFHAWGRCAAASRGTLRDWCRAVGERGRDVIAFMRLLRAVKAAHDERWRGAGPASPDLFLDIADDRHRRAFIDRAVPRLIDDMSPDEFLSSQRLIRNRALIEELRRLLRDAD